MIYTANKRHYKRIIFDGDSLTYQFLHAYPMEVYNSVNSSGPYCYYNFSVPGHTLQDCINKFSTDIAPNLRSGDVVVIWCGTNDLAGASGVSAATLYTRIQSYCALVHAVTGAKVVVCDVIARSILGADLPDMDTRRLAYNALLVGGNSFADGFVHLGGVTHLANLADATDTDYYGVDQVHLNTALGYPLVATNVSPVVAGLL